jgi:cytochrome c oxidase subunit 3
MAQTSSDQYYIPHGTNWPIIGSIGLFTMFVGLGNLLHGADIGLTLMFVGLAIVLFMVFGWFRTVIDESHKGMYNKQVDYSFRLGMWWFIFSEVMFFFAFFGALFYVRVLTIPWLGGEGAGVFNSVIWPDFEAVWPLMSYPDNTGLSVPTALVSAWEIPFLNTILLLSSGGTITWAHWALKENNRKQLILGMAATVALGILFLYFQAVEYGHAYNDLNLKLDSGIYGSTFFMLTGFHGFHVTLGTVMLIVILLRCMKGHFSKENHFAFEAVAWYWHFVDVVWIGLFIFVYWL